MMLQAASSRKALELKAFPLKWVPFPPPFANPKCSHAVNIAKEQK